MNIIINNIAAIGLTLIILAILTFILKWLFDKLVIWGENLATKLKYKLLFRGSVFIAEIILLVIFIVMLYFNSRPLIVIPLMAMALIIVIIGAEVRRERPKSFSLFNLIPAFFKKDTYILNRLLILIEELSSVMTLFVALVITFSFFSTYKWPIQFYFIMFIVLPLYSAFWVYFKFDKYNIRLNKENSINMRRLVVYTCLAAYIFYDLYTKFWFLTLEERLPASDDYIEFFFYSATVVFIALERIIKTAVDDYEKYITESSKRQDSLHSQSGGGGIR